jgi:hypothetical protein
MKLTYLLIVLLLTIVGFACKRSSPVEESRMSQPCGKAVVANAPNFSTVATDVFTITEASISGDCLTVTLGLSSACGEPASLSILHAPGSAAVYPPLHALKIALTYGSDCAMPGVRTYSFDLYPIRQQKTNKISVSITGTQGYYKTLQYAY